VTVNNINNSTKLPQGPAASLQAPSIFMLVHGAFIASTALTWMRKVLSTLRKLALLLLWMAASMRAWISLHDKHPYLI
jgi:hypothetical protein